MKNFIETTLEEKTRGLTTSILYSQWEFDKLLIPNALQAITAIFPHYSLHNESHSETIIANIIRIVGEDAIKQLSATDLWLLLEAAYCHDLGMVVTAEQAREAINSGKLLEHFKQIQSNTNHDLHFCTKDLKVVNNQIVFTTTNFSLAKTDTIKYLLADYFRGQHGKNAADYIVNPHATLSVDSPRVIIPARLYDLLGKICGTHTQDFGSVMNLPRVEDGIGIETAHPRFIACMLRLGDLLDIDNGRFSETLLRTLDKPLESTCNHRDKHLATKHKSITTKGIEIIAECNNKKVAHITQQWFNWIQDEFTTQTLAWNNIVPPRLNTFLPSVNQLRVHLKGYEYTDPKAKPVFTVDTPKALELLQGANFYKSPFKAIRELVQNAIDATLLRIWEEKGDTVKSIDDLLQVAKEYPISVDITPGEKKGTTILTIQDNGTGISREDLKYIAATGSSSKNTTRRAKIDKMETWMRPAGVFGIGFQSVFLLTDLVTIETNSIYTNQAYTVELHNPQSEYKGDIYIKEPKSTESSKIFRHGTTLSIIIDNKKQFGETQKRDFLDDGYHLGIDSEIDEEVMDIAKYSFVPIIINEEKVEREKFDFVSSNYIELKLAEAPYNGRYSGNGNCFKNINTRGINVFKFKGVINYHQGNSNVLELSRESVKAEYSKKISNECFIALEECFNDLKMKGYPIDIPYHFVVSLYLHTGNLSIKSELKDFILSNSVFQSQNIENEICTISVKQLLEKDKIIIRQESIDNYSLLIEKDKAVITGPFFRHDESFDILRLELLSYPFIGVTKCSVENRGIRGVIVLETEYSKTSIPDTSLLGLDKIKIVSNSFKGQQKYSFCYIPVIKIYEEIRIKPKETELHKFIMPYPIHSIPLILLPIYRINDTQWKDGRSDKFYDYVYENRDNKDVTKEEIIKLYDQMIEELKTLEFIIVS